MPREAVMWRQAYIHCESASNSSNGRHTRTPVRELVANLIQENVEPRGDCRSIWRGCGDPRSLWNLCARSLFAALL
jgi:hypothetical protein